MRPEEFQELPEGFQLAEDVLKHGFIDAIVERKDQKNMLIRLLNVYGYENKDDGEQADEDESGKDTDQDADRGAFHGVRSGHMPLPNEWMEQRDRWDAIVLRDMDKDVSWDASADKYLSLYESLPPFR